MSIFSLAKTFRANVKSLSGGRYQACVADEDGTVVLDEVYPSFGEAANAAQDMHLRLTHLRVKHLGVESLVELRDEYRKVKAQADALRDKFVKAKAVMASPEYQSERRGFIL